MQIYLHLAEHYRIYGFKSTDDMSAIEKKVVSLQCYIFYRLNYLLMSTRKVLYISQEITPYLPQTPMSTLCQRLPQGIQDKGFEVRTFMPKYGCINERRNQLHEVIRLSGMNLIIDDTDHPLIIKVATLQPARMQVYFIDNDDFFQHNLTSDIEIRTSPDDNDERSIFFVRGVIETVKKLRWEPAIVHCTGWISALAPLYLKRHYQDDPSFRSAKVVYSLFDDEFGQTLAPQLVEKLKMDEFTPDDMKALLDGPIGHTAMSRIAMDHADGIVVASAGVNPELIEYARATGKPLLEYPGDVDYVQAYADFYDSVLAQN